MGKYGAANERLALASSGIVSNILQVVSVVCCSNVSGTPHVDSRTGEGVVLQWFIPCDTQGRVIVLIGTQNNFNYFIDQWDALVLWI